MKSSSKDTNVLLSDNLNQQIVRSMLSSFRIEQIFITDKVASEAYKKALQKLKK